MLCSFESFAVYSIAALTLYKCIRTGVLSSYHCQEPVVTRTDITHLLNNGGQLAGMCFITFIATLNTEHKS